MKYIALWFITAALLIGHSSLYYPYIADDAYISMRYAERFMHGLGLTWNDHEYVEGYSNLLWVLSLSLLGKLGIDLEIAARLLGMACALATPLAFIHYARRNNVSFFALACTCLIYALLPPVAFWAIGGLEGPMVMLLIACAAVRVHRLLAYDDKRYAAVTGVLLGLVCLLRPEGPVYTLALLVPLMLCSSHNMHKRIHLAAFVSVTSAFFYLSQIAFRQQYYDALFANSLTAKVTFTFARLESGLAYVAVSSLFFVVPFLYAVIGNRHARQQTGDKAALWSQWPLVLPLVMLALVGGDIFPSARALVPLTPFVMLAFLDAAGFNLRGGDKKEKLFAAYMVGAAALFLVMMPTSKKQDEWVQEAAAIGRALNAKYSGTQPLVAVYAAGAIPYFSKLPSLDVLGLMDKELTARRKKNELFGQGLMGHELFDGAYVNRRAPDILAFNIPHLGSFCAPPRLGPGCKVLMDNYTRGTLDTERGKVIIWLRKGSRKVAE